MDTANHLFSESEANKCIAPEGPELISAVRSEVKARDGKVLRLLLLQTLFALFVAACIVLASGGYFGDIPDPLPSDVAEDAATRTLSSLYERWLSGDAIKRAADVFASERGSDSQSEQYDGSGDADESAPPPEESAPRSERLSAESSAPSFYAVMSRSSLSGLPEVPATATLAPVMTAAHAQSPIDSWDLTTVSSPFGYRIHPISGRNDFHSGIDIPAAYGTPIRAVFSGTVAAVGYSDIFGNYVLLEHTSGMQTRYCHCSRIAVSVGARVLAGETVAYVGSTGVSTGCHLHLDLISGGLYSDPRWLFVRAAGSGDR